MDNPFDILNARFDKLEHGMQLLSELLSNNISTPALVQSDNKDLMFSIDELAQYLRKSRATICRYKANKVIPYHQAGRTIFFKKSEVDAAMSSIVPLKMKGVKANG